MLKHSIVGLILIFITGYSYAQTSTCAQTLRLARSTYEQGRFHEIPALVEGCLQSGDGNFTKQEKVDALRILTLSYLYQEEPELADEAMLRLLNTDHYFEVNDNVDPAEFTALYRTFRTKPLFSIAGRFGSNSTYSTPTKNYYVGFASGNTGEYSPVFNIQYGLAFEKLLFARTEDPKWTAAPEILFVNHSASYANERLTTSDRTGLSYSSIDNNYKLSRLDLNLLMQYRLKASQINPYVTLGPGISYLMNSSGQIETQFPEEGSVVTGPSVDLKGTYKNFDFTIVAGAGVKYKFGEIFLTADVRYQYGITNLIKESDRSNPEAAFDYGFQSNDFRQSSLMINVGFIWPYFNPRKLLK